ncbi:hypothetical protein [Actinospica sp.]|jgi:hypothetical protein|uniref:hypothetical protein n=1 Tax=Actinospica sp. TaxID=1872142 RepID=UPI002BFAF074|nr:hypothetical protein [Actinospica sp.]HWG22692.1 hypothetical protein [Actinospica sp.]
MNGTTPIESRPTPTRTTRHGRAASTVVALLAAAALAACGSSTNSGSGTTSPTSAGGTFNTASAASLVKQTWTTFFAKSTPISQKAALLQNGQTMAGAMQAFASNAMVSEVTANVTDVTFPSSSKADVTYSISLNGQVVENAMQGQAVYQSGKWLVADTTLCGLLQLAASQSGSAAPIPGCG